MAHRQGLDELHAEAKMIFAAIALAAVALFTVTLVRAGGKPMPKPGDRQ